nr:MAG TPA: hypothetical protein [Caudoviricetes sp.]
MELSKLEDLGFTIQEKVINVTQFGDIDLKNLIKYKESDGFGILESENIDSYYDMAETSYIVLDENEDIVLEADSIEELIELIEEY